MTRLAPADRSCPRCDGRRTYHDGERAEERCRTCGHVITARADPRTLYDIEEDE